MDEKILFSAAVRTIGLLSLARGIYDLFYVFLYYLGLSDISVTAKAPNADLVFGIFYFLLGLYLVRGASLIINFAFPRKKYNAEAENGLSTKDNEL